MKTSRSEVILKIVATVFVVTRFNVNFSDCYGLYRKICKNIGHH